MSATPYAWTPARVELLKKLWMDGLSASQIAQQLGGVSRSAVIGKIHREKASYRALPSKPRRIASGLMRPDGRKAVGGAGALAAAKARSASATSEPRVKKATHTGGARKVAAILRTAKLEEAPPPVVFDASLAKPWLERRFGECAYPISGEGADTFSCCQPCGEASYCKGHQRVMFDRRPQTLAKSKSMQRWAGRVA